MLPAGFYGCATTKMSFNRLSSHSHACFRFNQLNNFMDVREFDRVRFNFLYLGNGCAIFSEVFPASFFNLSTAAVLLHRFSVGKTLTLPFDCHKPFRNFIRLLAHIWDPNGHSLSARLRHMPPQFCSSYGSWINPPLYIVGAGPPIPRATPSGLFSHYHLHKYLCFRAFYFYLFFKSVSKTRFSPRFHIENNKCLHMR